MTLSKLWAATDSDVQARARRINVFKGSETSAVIAELLGEGEVSLGKTHLAARWTDATHDALEQQSKELAAGHLPGRFTGSLGPSICRPKSMAQSSP